MQQVNILLLYLYLYFFTTYVHSFLGQGQPESESVGKLPPLEIKNKFTNSNRFTLFDVNGRTSLREVQLCDYTRYREEMRPLWIYFFRDIFNESVHEQFDEIVAQNEKTNDTTLDELCAFEMLNECVQLPSDGSTEQSQVFSTEKALGQNETGSTSAPDDTQHDGESMSSRLDGVCQCMNDPEVGIIQKLENQQFCVVPRDHLCNPWAQSLLEINKGKPDSEKLILPIVPEELFCEKDSGCHPHTNKCECAIGYKCGAAKATLLNLGSIVALIILRFLL